MRKTDGITPSAFEALTSAALLYFQKQRLDFLVMEAGMGGRLDATNAVDAKVALITNVGLEHTAELGGTIAKIAREKAGIIKPHAKAVTGCSQPPALREIQLAAKNNRASLKVLGKDFSYRVKSVSLDATEFDYSGTSSYSGLRSPLLGRHQAFNASCAIAAVECFQELGYRIPENAVRAGIADAEWPGRLEIMHRNPLVIVDGAHNPDGAKSLRAALRDLLPGKKPVFVLGILADKDFRRMISLLAPIASRMVFCRPSTPRAADPEVLAQEARKAGCSNVEVIPRVADAVRSAISVSGHGGTVIITGSLYTAGEARSALSARL
jgi:dihydrofolate synthase/folylpolyglutamate synthase